MDALRVLKALDVVHLHNQRGAVQALPTFIVVGPVSDAVIPTWCCYPAQPWECHLICHELQTHSCWCLTETLQTSRWALQDQFLCRLIFFFRNVGVGNYMYFRKL